MAKRLLGTDISKEKEVLPFFKGPLANVLIELLEARIEELDMKIRQNSVLHVRGAELAKELCLEQLGRQAELKDLLKDIKTLTGDK